MSLLFAISVPTLLLGILLACAVWHDVRERRIPNALVAGGAVAARRRGPDRTGLDPLTSG